MIRLLLVVLVSALPARAQHADAPRLVPFAGGGFGAAADSEAGWFAVHLAAGARLGVPTAQLRATALGQLLNRDQRWDVAALGGSTFRGPVGMVFVGVGPSLAGGIDKGSCFLAPTSCATTPGRQLAVRLGMGLTAEVGLRLPGQTFLTVQAMANIAGDRTTRGIAGGLRREF